MKRLPQSINLKSRLIDLEKVSVKNSFFLERNGLDTDPKMETFGLKTTWNRFEQRIIWILTLKFELKSHFIIFSKSKNVKIPPTSPLWNRSFGISFLKNHKIDQNLEFKIWKFKFQGNFKLISKISKITILGFWFVSKSGSVHCSLG